MRDSAAALKWIVEELERRDIPFALVGGVAANAYGTTRPLNDIDIDVPERFLPVLAEELKSFRTFGPERSISDCFDCQLLGFSYKGQEIELSGAEGLLIRDTSSEKWVPWPTDLSEVERRIVLGLTVPVMGRKQLIEYKRFAGRATDLMDVSELEYGYNNPAQ
jgi:hypothetical protein